MNKSIQKMAVWFGFIAIWIFFGALLIASWLPIPAPSLSMEQVAEMYSANTNIIRLCGVLIVTSTLFLFPFYSVLSVQLSRMEGPRPVLSWAQLAAGAGTSVFFILPGIMIYVIAFRPERAPEITYALNDLMFLVMITPWSTGFLQALVTGIVIVSNNEKVDLFPRWSGFLNFWIAFLLVPGAVIPFFKTGPFAWNGILGFWIPATVFGLFYFVNGFNVLRILKNEKASATN